MIDGTARRNPTAMVEIETPYLSGRFEAVCLNFLNLTSLFLNHRCTFNIHRLFTPGTFPTITSYNGLFMQTASNLPLKLVFQSQPLLLDSSLLYHQSSSIRSHSLLTDHLTQVLFSQQSINQSINQTWQFLTRRNTAKPLQGRNRTRPPRPTLWESR